MPPEIVRCERLADLRVFDCLGESGEYVSKIEYRGLSGLRALAAPLRVVIEDVTLANGRTLPCRSPEWGPESRWLTPADFPLTVMRGVDPPLA